MKKTSFHVNPAVNRWEEEQRRKRMEKMISRAKSTLPPEARGGAKQLGPKKPSPYSAENAARVRKRSSGGQEPVMDVQELDGLIYNRVQEILGMPIMRRAAAARAAGDKGGSSRSGRRPAWNNEWTMQTASSPPNHDDRHVGSAGTRSAAAAARVYDERGPKASSGVRRSPGQEAHSAPGMTPPRSGRPGTGLTIDVSPPMNGGSRSGGGGGLHRNTSLPHASAPGVGSRGPPSRPASTRYSGGGMEPSAGAAAASRGSHALEQSVMSAIAALNPQSAAAQEAANRNKQQALGRTSARPGAGSGIPHAPGTRGSRPPPSAAGSQSLMARAARGPGSATPSSARRPPSVPSLPQPRASASGSGLPSGSPALAEQGGGKQKGKEKEDKKEEEDEDDAYGDDDFEDYEGSDGEGAVEGGRGKSAAGEEGDGEGSGGLADALPDLALLRHSVNALNGLVQMKIQQQVARSQQLKAQRTPGATPDGANDEDEDREMLASMALAGTEEAEAQGLFGRQTLEESAVIDGLRQSDLDYLARLGTGGPHDNEVGSSHDERAFVIEPGAPAGTAKVWGDRKPWASEKQGATGLEALRARQEKERLKQQDEQQQQQGAGGGGGGPRSSRQGAEGVSTPSASGQADEDDSVLLGETISPRHRSGAAAQMQAVGSALAALASTGQLALADAQDLRSQTDALYGSLVQLHNLMTGPRAAELRPSPSGGEGTLVPASGFTPTAMSPADSPSQTVRLTPGGADQLGSSRAGLRTPSIVPPDGSDPRASSGVRASAKVGDREDPNSAQEPTSHIQLTPKNRLVAEDVAWMAGLVQSLSRSLQVDQGELDLPGI